MFEKEQLFGFGNLIDDNGTENNMQPFDDVNEEVSTDEDLVDADEIIDNRDG